MNRKWTIAIGLGCGIFLFVLGVCTTLFHWQEKLSLYFFEYKNGIEIDKKNISTVGTRVGQGQGHILFPIGNSKTHVEAVAIVKSIPQKGDILKAVVYPGYTVSGQVQDVMNFVNGYGKVRILSFNENYFGLVTVGVIVRP